MATPEPTQPSRPIDSIYVHPSVRTAVMHAVSPHIDNAHRNGSRNETVTLKEVRDIIAHHLAFRDLTPEIAASELMFLSASLLSILEQRVLLEQRS